MAYNPPNRDGNLNIFAGESGILDRVDINDRHFSDFLNDLLRMITNLPPSARIRYREWIQRILDAALTPVQNDYIALGVS